MAADDPRHHAALGRAWDVLLAGRPDPAGAAEPVLTETIVRLHRLDRRFAASPAFLARLEEDLMDNVALDRSPRRNGVRPKSDPVAILPAPTAAPRPRRIDRPRRRGPAELATAALLLLTLGLGVVAFRLAPPPSAPDRTSLPSGGAPASPPVAPSAATAASPPDVTCKVAPRTVEEIVTLYGPSTPIPTPGQPVPTMSLVTTEPTPYLPAITLPPGRPADSATVAAVTETWRRWLACTVSWDDRLRAAALLTEDGFRRVHGFASLTDLALFLDPPSYDDAPEPTAGLAPGAPTFAPTIGVPTPPAALPTFSPSHAVRAQPLADVRLLADGRVGARLDTPMGEPDPEGRNYVVFAKVGDRWLIDEIVRTPAG